MDNTTVKKRVEYKADVAWWDVELDGTFEGKYTVRILYGIVTITKRYSQSSTALECQV